jgi:Flp pilus assembly protein TadG
MPHLPAIGAQCAPRRSRRSGGSLLEITLLFPWFFFLFVGAFDWGYYAHALISTQAAVRAAVLYTSQNATTATDQATACIYALNELKIAQNVPNSGSCNAAPIIVTAGLVNSGADGQPAASVTVKYQTLALIPIPGLLGNQFWITQTVQMRLRS